MTPDAQPGLACEADSFSGCGDLALRHRRWAGAHADRAFAIVHGFAEHSERYDRVARWLAERGYAVHAFDQRGHGESAGPRNHTPSFGVLLDDIERFLERVRADEGERPLVLFGHSMGGLEVATLLAERQPAIAAGVLSGPALGLGPGVSRGRIRTAKLLSGLAPRVRFPTGLDAAGLSRDPAVVDAYLADPRIHTFATARLGAELFGASERAPGLAPGVSVPLLIVHGEADPLCDVEASRHFHRDLRPAGCEIRSYPGLLHEILNEPEWEQVLRDVHGWIEKHVPGPGSGAPARA
jgi:alpha-beta hydrolase superfamily lysophospholipase